MQVNPIRKVVSWLLLPRFVPHLYFYLFSKKRKIIRSDVKNISDFIYKLAWDITYRNIFYYRVGRMQILFSWLAPRCPYTKINQNMTIGKSFNLEHAFVTFINARSVGDNFHCWHNVTIGSNGGKLPKIGNNVAFFMGSAALGGVNIGNNVKIGAYTLILNDVPDDCTVVGNPATIVKLKGQKVCIPLKDYKKTVK